jgi:RNA polymerase sigma-70 factor (sigma-E family)
MRAQDEADFAEFVASSSVRLFRSAYALCGDAALAQDAVQASLTSAFLAWRRVRGADSPEAYVRRMVVNQLFGWRRRKGWSVEQSYAAVPDAPLASHEQRVVDSDAVWRALATLPARQRAVLVLRYYEDMTEADIAATLGIRAGTVKSQAAAALAHLRRGLGQDVLVSEGELR